MSTHPVRGADELVGGGPRPGEVAGGEQDLHRGRAHRALGRRYTALPQHAAHGSGGHRDLSLGQPDQRHPGRGSRPCSRAARYARSALGRLAAQPVQLAQLVEGEAQSRMDGVGEDQTRPLRLGDRLVPRAVRLQDLRPVHEALAAVGHEVRLARAPAVQRLGPFGSASQVEGIQAGFDHGAVDDAGGDGGDLPRGDAEHDLVEQPQAAAGVTAGDRRLPLAEQPERQQVGIAEPPSLAEDLARERLCLRDVAGDERFQEHRHEQKAPGRAVPVRLRDEPLRPGQPPAGPGDLAAQEQQKGEPERAARGAVEVARTLTGALRTLPGQRTLGVSADQVGGHGESLEVRRVQRLGRGEQSASPGPGAAVECVASELDPARHARIVVPRRGRR